MCYYGVKRCNKKVENDDIQYTVKVFEKLLHWLCYRNVSTIAERYEYFSSGQELVGTPC